MYHVEEYFELKPKGDQEVLLSTDSNINNYRSTELSPTSFLQQNSIGSDCPKAACNDYTALQNWSNFASAQESYSNLEKSFTYDYARALEHSEVSTNIEEIYFDPGHSKADIYACFERKQFHIIKNRDVRCVAIKYNNRGYIGLGDTENVTLQYIATKALQLLLILH